MTIRSLAVPGVVPVASGSLATGTGAARAAASAPVTLDAGMRFSAAGVLCDTPRGTGGVVVRVRASSDGSSWGGWVEAELEKNGQAGRAGESFIEPLWFHSARFVQVSARTAATRAPVELANVRVVAIRSFAAARDASIVLAARSRAATAALASFETAALASSAAPATFIPPKPAIVSRRAWGADESIRKWPPDYAPVKMAFIHHTATGNDYTQDEVPAIMRAIYKYHAVTLGWNDIGYNFLVDRYGTIYEGRYGGVAKGVVGAQVLGFNAGSTGVSVIGNFVKVEPPPEALAALESLLAWKLSLRGLDPTATARIVCDATDKYKAGATVTFPVIAGHRDANHTECPGNSFYPLLPTVRDAVKLLMVPVPAITGFTPATGPAGTVVTVTGTGFDAATAVTFGATAADFTVDSATQLTATVPLGALSGPIAVTTPGGTGTSATDFTVTLVQPLVSLKLKGLTGARAKLGRHVVAAVSVRPLILAGGAVELAAQRRQGGAWTDVKTSSRRITATGAFNWLFTPTRKGAYRIRVTMPETATNAAATTPWGGFRVR